MNDDTTHSEASTPHAGVPQTRAATASVPTGDPGPGATSNPETAVDGSATEARTSAPTQQELAVRLALESVLDPEIGLSVIDLGLIREINIFPDRTHVRMMLTTPFCPYAPQMMADVKQATEAVVPVPCDVEIMPDAWSPQLMPDPGLLGYSF